LEFSLASILQKGRGIEYWLENCEGLIQKIFFLRQVP
jgi:hypothetical protein